jgi:EpsI family protein
VARSLLFPLCFLFFAVPVGEFLLPLLMQWTADVTIFAVRHSGIPVWREGNSFAIPSGRWSVVEACSGVRYLIASFMVGTLFAYLSYRSLQKRLLFALASLLVPVLANWMRAYLIVMLGHLSNNRIATGVDHVLYGWIFFGIVIALMFLLGSRWADPPLDAPPPSPVPAAAHALAQPQGGAVMLIWVAALGLVLLAALPGLAHWRLGQSAGALSDGAASAVLPAPQLAPAWPVVEGAAPAFKPSYRQPPAEWQAMYGPAARQVGLYVALYRQQQRGQALVSSDNALLPSHDPQWLQVAQGSQTLRLQGQILTLGSSVLQSAGPSGGTGAQSLQVWQLYWVHGHVTRSALVAKFFGALARLSGQRDDAALLLAYAPSGAAGEGDAALAAFWSDNYAALTEWLLRNSGTHENVLKGSP